MAVGQKTFTPEQILTWASNPWLAKNPQVQYLLQQLQVAQTQALQRQTPLTSPAQRAQYGIPADDSGIWSVDGQNKLSRIATDPQPTSVQEYEYYKATLPPGQPPMQYDQWATAKARAAAMNVSVNNVGASQETAAAKAVGEAQGQIVADAIKAGATAAPTIHSLASIAEAARAGGDNITTGPLASLALSGKQIGSSLGIDMGEGLPG